LLRKAVGADYDTWTVTVAPSGHAIGLSLWRGVYPQTPRAQHFNLSRSAGVGRCARLMSSNLTQAQRDYFARARRVTEIR
jgi:hypothetical protein